MDENIIIEIQKILASVSNVPTAIGFSNDEIDAAEKRLDVQLPKILKEFYLQFGKHPIYQDSGSCFAFCICTPSELAWEDDETEDKIFTIFRHGVNGYFHSCTLQVSGIINNKNPLVTMWDEDACNLGNYTLEYFLKETTLHNFKLSFTQRVSLKDSDGIIKKAIKHQGFSEIVKDVFYHNEKQILIYQGTISSNDAKNILDLLTILNLESCTGYITLETNGNEDVSILNKYPKCTIFVNSYEYKSGE